MVTLADNPLASASFDTGSISWHDAGNYDAARDTTKRRRSPSRPAHEDRILKRKGRDKLAGGGYDLQRNFAAAAWAIRKHLDYVSSFRFQAKTSNKDFNAVLEQFVANWSSRHKFDSRRKHSLRRALRLAEASRTVGGDVGFAKLVGSSPSDFYRGKVALIEPDLVQNPKKRNRDDAWFNGVLCNEFGVELGYAVHKRKRGGYEFSRFVPSSRMLMLGYYERVDQVRGISPLSTAINLFKDSYQGFDYALAKLKVAQLFGLVVTTNATEGLGDHYSAESDELEGDGDEAASKYEVDFGDGPVKLELEEGEKAEFIESGTPPTETVDFLRLVILLAIKSLDIPFSFFDESFTNFYGSRGGLMQYLKSCKAKRADIQELLDEILRWRLALAIIDGEIELPAGMTFDEILWKWIPDGVAWWDPAKEARGEALACAAGFNNIIDVCASVGTDAFDNIDRNAEVIEYAEQRGVPLVMPGAAAFNPEPVVSREEGSSDAES